MMSALGFVPRIAAYAVVTPPNIVDAFDAMIDHSCIQHQDGRRVLESGHHLGVVREGNLGPFASSVIANHQSSFVIQGKCSLNTIVIEEGRLVVVPKIDARVF